VCLNVGYDTKAIEIGQRRKAWELDERRLVTEIDTTDKLVTPADNETHLLLGKKSIKVVF
jgi:hypothetical protein